MDWSRNIRKQTFGGPASQKLVTSAMLFAFGGHGNREGKFDNCGSVTILNDGNYAVADTNNRRIQIFDTEGNHVKTVSHKERLRLPWGVSSSGTEDTFYVTDGELNSLIKITSEGDIVTEFKLEGIQEAGPLAVQPRTNLAFVSDVNTPNIYIYNLASDCQLLRILRLDPPDGVSVAENIAVDANNDVFVAFGSSSRQIYCYSEKGELRGTFGDFQCPSGLWVTPTGNLIIADREDRSVHLYSNIGRPIQMLINQGLGLNAYPHFVCLSRDNRIVLTATQDFFSYPDRIHVFKLQSQ